MGIYEQLADCNCIDKEVTESDVDELIALISMATCWTHEPCETLETAERSEVIELPECMDDCDVYIFKPFYHPFNVESFEFRLIRYKGTDIDVIPITDYSYSDVDGEFRMKVPIPSCKCRVCTCGCEPTYKLAVTYTAGYDEIPDCLIPIFCEALRLVMEKNACDCTTCTPCQINGEIVEIDYSNSETIGDQLSSYLVRLFTREYKRQLSLISLCKATSVWGVVV